jgi:hypothetical protein
VLAVVDDEQGRSAGQARDAGVEQAVAGADPQPERGGQRGQRRGRVLDLGEREQRGRPAVEPRHLGRQPRLAHPARPEQRHQPLVHQPRLQVGQLVGPAEERQAPGRQRRAGLLGRHHGRRRWRRRRRCRGHRRGGHLAGCDRLLELGEGGRGVEPGLLGHRATEGGAVAQRVGGPAGGGEGPHQQQLAAFT